MKNRCLAFIIVTILLFSWPSLVWAGSGPIFIGTATEALGLDPRTAVDGPSMERINVINEALVRFNADMELEPLLARSWKFQKEGQRVTFLLQEGVLWHDGTPFTAADVKYTYDWVLDEQNLAPVGALCQDIEFVEIAGDYEVIFHLKRANSFFPYSVALLPIVPKHDGNREDFALRPLGTGPYKFKSWQYGNNLVLEANEKYWQGPPANSGLTFQVFTDDEIRLLAFEAGMIDILREGPVPEELPRLEEDPHILVHRSGGGPGIFMGFNSHRGIMADGRIRLALCHILNQEAILALVLNGRGRAGIGPLAVDSLWFNPAISTYEYDLGKAKELLARAGYPAGGFTLNLSTDKDPIRLRLAEIFQWQCARLGISVNIIGWETELLRTHLQESFDFDVYITSQEEQMVADWAFYPLFHTKGGGNYGGYSHGGLDHLLEYGRRLPVNSSESQDVYRQIQKIINLEAPGCFIIHGEIFALSHAHIKGWFLHPYPPAAWQELYLFAR